MVAALHGDGGTVDHALVAAPSDNNQQDSQPQARVITVRSDFLPLTAPGPRRLVRSHGLGCLALAGMPDDFACHLSLS